MTNEVKAAELAYYYAGENDYKESAAYSAAMGMAQWKDEQFEKEKQELIDKACEWWENELIYSSMPHSVIDIILGRIAEFKKAMKGGKNE